MSSGYRNTLQNTNSFLPSSIEEDLEKDSQISQNIDSSAKRVKRKQQKKKPSISNFGKNDSPAVNSYSNMSHLKLKQSSASNMDDDSEQQSNGNTKFLASDCHQSPTFITKFQNKSILSKKKKDHVSIVKYVLKDDFNMSESIGFSEKIEKPRSTSKRSSRKYEPMSPSEINGSPYPKLQNDSRIDADESGHVKSKRKQSIFTKLRLKNMQSLQDKANIEERLRSITSRKNITVNE